MSFYKNNKPANWIKSFSQNGMTYHLSENGGVKITDPEGKVLVSMSGRAAQAIVQHIDGLTSFIDQEVNPYLEEKYKKDNDQKIVKSLQKRVEKTAADLEVLAKLNPELVTAILKKAAGQ